MLYVTTRSKYDTFTINRAILENRSSDGGFYLPLKIVKYSEDELRQLLSQGFSSIVAGILNKLLHTKLNSWDVDFAIGRYPVRCVSLGFKVTIAETWHNPEWSYERLVNNLSSLIVKPEFQPSDWIKIVIRIAVLFGVYGERWNSSLEPVDFSVVSGDFSTPVSVWYARKLGLPVGNIICCCNENNVLWELLSYGCMHTDAVTVPTKLPEADVILPLDFERFVYECGGSEEVERYLNACQRGRMYIPSDAALTLIREAISVSVISSHRIDGMIPNVFRTHNYLISSYTALAYAGLLDYRAKSAIIRPAVVWSEHSPLQDVENISRLLNSSTDDLKCRMFG